MAVSFVQTNVFIKAQRCLSICFSLSIQAKLVSKKYISLKPQRELLNYFCGKEEKSYSQCSKQASQIDQCLRVLNKSLYYKESIFHCLVGVFLLLQVFLGL